MLILNVALSNAPTSEFGQSELIRLSFIVYRDPSTEDANAFLITFDDWLLLTQLAPLRNIVSLWNYRVKVFPVNLRTRDGGVAMVANEPEICPVDNPRLQCIRWWQFHA